MRLHLKTISFISLLLLIGPSSYAETIEKDAKGLAYYLYIPSAYNPSTKYPLIVALHWSTARGTDMIERWQEQAEKKGYIVACPNSDNPDYWDIKVEDSAILGMINEIIKGYSINQNRIYVTGFSAGGTYAYYLGLAYPEIFSASAPFAGSLKWLISKGRLNLKAVKKKIPIYIFHGSSDIMVKIEESYFARDELAKYGFNATLKEIKGLDHQYPSYVTWQIIRWFE